MTNITAYAFNLGICFSFDGTVFINTQIGSYHLIYNVQQGLYVQASFVKCKQTYVCIDSIGIKYSNDTIVIQTSESVEASVLINNQKPTSMSVIFGTGNRIAKLQRLSRLQFSFEISSSLVIQIRLSSRYLDISCSALDRVYCVNSTGLWGSCNNNTIDDLYPRSHSRLPKNDSLSELSMLTQNYLANVFIASWKVNSSTDFQLLNTSFSPYALRINKTILISEPMFTITGPDTTVEIYVRITQPGVLWSYSSVDSFGLFFNRTLVIFQDANSVDTGLVLALNEWYKISVVYEEIIRTLKVYVTDMSGNFNLRTFKNAFSVKIFRPGGILTLGSWKPPASGKVVIEGFKGDIFEFRVWNKTVSTNEIRSTVSDFISCSTSDLASMWKFEIISDPVDCVSNIRLRKVEKDIVSRITWSRASLKNVYPTTDFTKVFVNVKKLRIYEHRCRELVGSASFARCAATKPNAARLFVFLCLRELWITNENALSSSTALAFSDYCQKSDPNLGWPAKSNCRLFPPINRQWSGLSCNTFCQYGHFDNNDKCVCMNGFYGDNCSTECPGGFANSCFGQSPCDKKTGNCNCLRNFYNQSCVRCAKNWTSLDCGVAQRSSSPVFKSYVCQSFKKSIITLSGAAVDLNTHGEFHLLKAGALEIQGRYVACSNASLCLHAVGVKIDANNFTVYNPNSTYADKYAWLNGRSVEIRESKMIADNLRIIPVSSGKLRVDISGSKPLNISITFLATGIAVTIESNSCAAYTGLCGSCNTLNDNSNRTSSRLVNEITQAAVIPRDSSVFLYHKDPLYEQYYSSDFGYMIYLDNYGLVSSDVSAIFSPTTDFTIEIFTKLLSSQGTLLSFANTDTDGIVLDDTIKVYHGAAVLDTRIKVKISEWVRIVLTFNAKIYVLSVFQFTADQVYEVQKFILNKPLFESRGHLSLGYWQTTLKSPDVHQAAAFRGLIDELRIWTLLKSEFELTYLHRARIPHSINLKVYWNFNEAHGTTALDLVSSISLKFPKNLNALKFWRFSDQLVYSRKIRTTGFTIGNLTLKAEIHRICSALIYHKDLETKCGQYIGKAFVDFYFLRCIHIGYSNSKIQDVYASVISYIEYCHVAMKINSWPRSAVCNLIPSRYYTAIDATRCTIACVFGDVDKKLAKCVCSKGYWGNDCSEVCPGGTVNTCSGKGDCNVTNGACDCQENWKGNSNCSACSDGWSGNECQLVITPEAPTSVCSLMSGGHLVSLNNVHTTFFGHGEFVLLAAPYRNTRIHVHQISCKNDRTRCVTGVALKTSAWILTLKVVENEDLDLVVNGEKIEFASTAVQFGNITVTKKETSLYEIQTGDNKTDGLSLQIRLLEQELAITLRVTGRYCKGSTSLCSTCSESDRRIFEASQSSLEAKFRVPVDKLLLSKNSFEASVYRLKLRGSGVSTNVLPSLYYNKDLTIEMKFRATGISKQKTVLFCVSKFNAFGLIIDKTLKIVLSSTIYDSGLPVEENQVNHVTLVYSHMLKKITLYYINTQGTMWHFKLNLPPWFRFFEPYGTLVIGEWLPGYRDMLVAPAQGFHGFVYDMRIWNHAYSFLDVKKLAAKNVTASDAGLLSLWKFNHGKGNLVIDLVSRVSLFVPLGFTAPQWVRVTVHGKAIPIGNDVHFASSRKKQEAINWCYIQFYSSPLHTACSKLGRQSIG